MLRELHISNLAVIADARIDLTPGLNCFTGATGAGKSLVIGAIEILLGLRSPADMLRPGLDEARVSGLFEIADPSLVSRISSAADINLADNAGQLLVTRRVYSSGRSSVSINGNPVTLAMLKTVSELLVDVHGQHDHQYLLKPSNQLEVLDQFANAHSLRKQYNDAWNAFQAAQTRLADLTAGQKLRAQQLELYEFQANEIDAVNLNPDEYEELTARESVLKNVEKLKSETTAAHSQLYDAEGAILERLKYVYAVIADLSTVDPALEPIKKNLSDAAISLEESAFDLQRYLDKLDLDPAELAEVTDRLNTLNRILHKFGPNPQDLLDFRKSLQGEIDQLKSQTDDLTTLAKELAPLKSSLKKLGEKLSETRKAAAKKLAPKVVASLAVLGMEKAKFSIDFAPAPVDPSLGFPASPFGPDAIEFMAMTNPGQLPQPLRKIASGGELSRIMLALKEILAQTDRVSILVFDEIDSNVGGRLGAIIGEKLRALSSHHQVLCITHLPQIAAYADNHLSVHKLVKDGQTQTSVKTLKGDARIEELSEMIGGKQITPTTRAQAKELLETAKPPVPSTSRRRNTSARK